MFFSWDDENLILNIRVLSNSPKDQFTDVLDNRIKLRITATPVDGKANSHIISFLSKLFKVPKSNIEILSGTTNKNKRLRITKPRIIPAFISSQINQ